MEIEQRSMDNVTVLFYIVVSVFPVLAVLEICLYCIYQKRVDILQACHIISMCIFVLIDIFQFHPWIEIINDQVTENYSDDEDEVPEPTSAVSDHAVSLKCSKYTDIYLNIFTLLGN